MSTINYTATATATATDTLKIIQTIEQVCATRQLTCIHAIESGSRAWGFASPDSDYDVRLLYAREPAWYLRLFEGKDTFEFIQDDLLDVPFDIGGWDIKKALQLIYKSNAVIFEWLRSPIVYQQQDIMAELQTLSLDYFQPRAAYHHYRGMAKTASANLDLAAPIKLKTFFYLLRSLLAAKWISAFATPPPVIMHQMFELIDYDSQAQILELIEIKSTCNESYMQSLSALMQNMIHKLWDSIDNPEFTEQKKPSVEPLNELYRRIVFDK